MLFPWHIIRRTSFQVHYLSLTKCGNLFMDDSGFMGHLGRGIYSKVSNPNSNPNAHPTGVWVTGCQCTEFVPNKFEQWKFSTCVKSTLLLFIVFLCVKIQWAIACIWVLYPSEMFCHSIIFRIVKWIFMGFAIPNVSLIKFPKGCPCSKCVPKRCSQ